MDNNSNSNGMKNNGGDKRVSVSATTIVLAVIIFIILVVALVITLVKVNSNQSNQDASITGNESNSSGQINSINNAVNEFTNNYLNETNNTTDHNQNNNVDNTNTVGSVDNDGQIDKLDISDENLVNILAETEDFTDGSKLAAETYVAIVYRALNEGYIVLDKSRSNESGKSTVEYSTDEINRIVYSIFGVKLNEYKNFGEVFVYKNGKYVLQFSDGGTGSFVIKNLGTDVAAGTEYISYDLYYKDEMGEDFRGNYSIGINNQTHFVSKKKKM